MVDAGIFLQDGLRVILIHDVFEKLTVKEAHVGVVRSWTTRALVVHKSGVYQFCWFLFAVFFYSLVRLIAHRKYFVPAFPVCLWLIRLKLRFDIGYSFLS